VKRIAALGPGLLLLLAACARHAAREEPALAPAAPEAVGLSSARLREIHAVARRYVDEGKLAGVVTAIARRGRLAQLDAVGMADLEAGRPMRTDAIFRIHSMTKPIASVAAMMLWEEGRFGLDDPVSKFVPELRGLRVFAGESEDGLVLVEPEREPSVRDLLRHTSGLGAGWHPDSPVDALYRKQGARDRDGTLQDLVEKLARIPLHEQPGTRWRYGVSTDVLGLLIERVSGERLDAFLRRRIFEPLRMPDTGFSVPAPELPRLAASYGPAEGGGLRLLESPAASRYASPPSFLSAGGGLVSTAMDYLRFAQMLLNGGELDGVRLLRPETVALMTRNQLPDSAVPIDFGFEQVPDFPGTGFGLGFSVRVDLSHPELAGSLGEYGWGGAASTRFWVAPREQLIGLVMTQLMPDFTWPIDQEVKALGYAAILD
jgi:CubicO group peptidase (beta-lactamase class C family)